MNERLALLFSVPWLIVSMTASADERPFLTTKTPVTLLSANDGEIALTRSAGGEITKRQRVKDSVTIVHLGPDHPPEVLTVYGIAPSTVWGAPYTAIIGNGRYGFVTNHGDRDGAVQARLESPEGQPVSNDDLKQEDLDRQFLSARLSNLVTVLDLASPELKVVKRFALDEEVWHAVSHPDGKRALVGCTKSIREFGIENGQAKLLRSHPTPVNIDSFALSPKGDWLITHGFHRSPAGKIVTNGIHAFKYSGDEIRYVGEIRVQPGARAKIDQPFAPRISPDGKRALTLNGWGIPGKGTLDAVLSIDLTLDKPMVTEVVPQVGDGLESLTFHPTGEMAVVACLDYDSVLGVGGTASLGVLDLTISPARLLYHTPVESPPQGIEFTPEGDKLFVGLSSSNRIIAFDVDGFVLKRLPFFIKTGHGHASMAIAPRYPRK